MSNPRTSDIKDPALQRANVQMSIDYPQAGKKSAKLIGQFILILGGQRFRSR